MSIYYFFASMYLLGGLNVDNSIFFLKDYGKVTLKLKEFMKKKHITRNKLSILTGSTYNVIDRYYQNDISRLDLDVIARICFVLECNISDIIVYEKNK